jgi:pimeloyl-ACP methyl ester carboxylesterase
MMASVLGAAIQELVGDQPANLVGHSLGGFSVLNIAARMPELVHSIICISGLAHCQCIGSIGKLQQLARGGAFARLLFRMNLRLPSLSPPIFRTALGQYAADQEALYSWPGLQEGLDGSYPDAKQLDGRAMLQYFSRLPDIDITSLLGQITAPTLVLGGEADPIVPPAQFRLIAEKVPYSRLVLWEGCGHLPQGERSSLYQQAIASWIEEHT